MLRPFSSSSRICASMRSLAVWQRLRCSERSPTNRPFSSSMACSLSSSRWRSLSWKSVSSSWALASRSADSTSPHCACRRRRSSTARLMESSRTRADISLNRCARSTCRSRGLSWRRTSRWWSRARCRCWSMPASLRTERSLRRLCLEMPAASSMRLRRSSGRLMRMASSLPWLMMECVSLPRPESCRMSWMSSRRDGAPLMRYSLSPERYMRRVMATSSKSTGSTWSELSSTRSTSATPTGLRAEEPANTTSSMAWPRRCLALCSPSTHRMASEMLDLPEPLGPTTTVRPGSKTMRVLSANDLNPLRVRDFRYTGGPTLGRSCRAGGAARAGRGRTRPPPPAP